MKKYEKVLKKFDALAAAWQTEIDALNKDGCPQKQIQDKELYFVMLCRTIGAARDEIDRKKEA